MDDFMSSVDPQGDTSYDAARESDAADAIRSLDDVSRGANGMGYEQAAQPAASEASAPEQPRPYVAQHAANPYADYADHRERVQVAGQADQSRVQGTLGEAYEAPAQPTGEVPAAAPQSERPQQYQVPTPQAYGTHQSYGTTQGTYVGQPSGQAQQAPWSGQSQQDSTQQRIPYINRQQPVGQYAQNASFAAQTPVMDEAPASGSDLHNSSDLRVVESKKGSGTLKSLLVGLAGGAVSAAAVTLALGALGIGGKTNTLVVQSSDSAAGQTITINAETEDATVAQAAAAKALPSVVSVYVSSSEGYGLGSGVILDTEGNIITNYHVVEGAQSVSVTIGGKSYDATVVGTDASSDLAVVHAELNGDAVTPIEVGDSDELVVGDWVMTIGSPFGLDQSVSAGIVSSLSRNQMMESYTGTTLYVNLIQTDASINPGNSGGALVNAEGKLVGINTLFSSDTESFAGIGFSIPGNYAVEIAKKIIAGEQVTHAYIGLSMQTVNAQNAQEYHLSVNQGAYVAEVAEGGPAEAAGIEVGDVIIALGDDEITSADGMVLAVRSHKIGETATVTFMRGNEKMEVEVTFGDDADLQRYQQEQREQQEEQGYGQEGMPGDPYGEDDGDVSFEDIFDWLFDNRGGSYDVSE